MLHRILRRRRDAPGGHPSRFAYRGGEVPLLIVRHVAVWRCRHGRGHALGNRYLGNLEGHVRTERPSMAVRIFGVIVQLVDSCT